MDKLHKENYFSVLVFIYVHYNYYYLLPQILQCVYDWKFEIMRNEHFLLYSDFISAVCSNTYRIKVFKVRSHHVSQVPFCACVCSRSKITAITIS